MGMSIDAKLIYGCYYSELPEEILDEVNEMLDDGDLDYASPTYDAPRDEWVVGVEVNIEGLSPHEASCILGNINENNLPDVLYDEPIEYRLIVSPDVT